MPEHHDMPRFSDQQLTELRVDFDQHKDEQERRWGQLAAMVEENTEAVKRIADAVECQAESTAGIVQLYQDLQGAARIGVGLRKFMTWLVGLGSAGIAIAAAISYVLKKFGGP